MTSHATPVIHAIWRAHQLLPRIYSSDLDRLHQSIEKSPISMIEALDRPAGANVLRLPQHETGNTREILNPPIVNRAKVMEWRRLWIDEFGSSIFAETIVVATGADVGSTGRDLLNSLPRTLLKEIVDQLPTVDTIRLACCNKTLHEEFGSGTYWCERFCEMKGFVRIAEAVPLPVTKVPTRGDSNTRSTFEKGLAVFLSQRPSATSASTSSQASAQESKGTGEVKELPKTDLSQRPFSKSEKVDWAFLCYQEEAIVQAMQDERVKKTMARITASETQRLAETKTISNTWLRSLGRG